MGGESTWRWWGYLNTRCCNQTCLNLLHSEVAGTQKPSFQLSLCPCTLTPLAPSHPWHPHTPCTLLPLHLPTLLPSHTCALSPLLPTTPCVPHLYPLILAPSCSCTLQPSCPFGLVPSHPPTLAPSHPCALLPWYPPTLLLLCLPVLSPLCPLTLYAPALAPSHLLPLCHLTLNVFAHNILNNGPISIHLDQFNHLSFLYSATGHRGRRVKRVQG